MKKLPNAVRVFASATVANVACGFDILGFAVAHPGDEVVAKRSEIRGVTLTAIHGDGGKLPTDPERNTATVAVLRMLESLGDTTTGIEIELWKKMPLGSGLGSSAASSAASLVAANTLLGNPLSPIELLSFAAEAERVACGAAHADNVAPALLGGFVLIRSAEPLDVIQLPVPENLCCAVVHPHIEVRTEDARKILRQQISLQLATQQWGNTAALVASLYKGDFELLGRSMQDVIVEPTRSLLIPGFDDIKQRALSAGALGCSISGSGPSVFTLTVGLDTAQKVGESMVEGFTDAGVKSDLHVSAINSTGPVIDILS